MTTPSNIGRRCSIAAAIVLSLALLTACGSSGSKPAQTQDTTQRMKLSVLDYNTDEATHNETKATLTACAAKVNATIDYQSIPIAKLNAKILQQLATKTLPDLLMINNPDLPQFAQTGALSDLSKLGVDSAGYYPSVLKVGKYKNVLYGLAPTVNSLELFYNKKMLADAQVAVPTTWDELRDAAAKLTQGDRYGFAYSATSGTEGTWQFIPFLWSNGGSQLKLDAPEAVEALKFYTGLALDGSVSKSAVNWGQADVNDQFAAGHAAMMENGPWQIPALEATKGLDWGSVPLPAPKAGGTTITPLGGFVWTVPVTSTAHETRAVSVLACLNSPKNQLKTALATNRVPGSESVARKAVQQQPLLATITDIVADARPLTDDSGLKWNVVNAALSAAIQSVITGQADATQALKTAQAAVDNG